MNDKTNIKVLWVYVSVATIGTFIGAQHISEEHSIITLLLNFIGLLVYVTIVHLLVCSPYFALYMVSKTNKTESLNPDHHPAWLNILLSFTAMVVLFLGVKLLQPIFDHYLNFTANY